MMIRRAVIPAHQLSSAAAWLDALTPPGIAPVIRGWVLLVLCQADEDAAIFGLRMRGHSAWQLSGKTWFLHESDGIDRPSEMASASDALDRFGLQGRCELVDAIFADMHSDQKQRLTHSTRLMPPVFLPDTRDGPLTLRSEKSASLHCLVCLGLLRRWLLQTDWGSYADFVVADAGQRCAGCRRSALSAVGARRHSFGGRYEQRQYVDSGRQFGSLNPHYS